MFKGTITVGETVIQAVGYDLRTSLVLNLLDVDPTTKQVTERIVLESAPGWVQLPETSPQGIQNLAVAVCSILWSLKASTPPSSTSFDHSHKGSIITYPTFTLKDSAFHMVNHAQGNLSLQFEAIDYVPVESLTSSTPSTKLYLKPRPAASITSPTLNRTQLYSFEEVRLTHPTKNFDWLLDRDYTIVTTENLHQVAREIMAHEGPVAFDTETTGLGISFNSVSSLHGADHLMGLVFSIKEGSAWYVPLLHQGIANVCSAAEVPAVLDKYFKPILENKELVTFNGSFDSKVMFPYGIIPNVKYDIMLGYILSEMWSHGQGGVPDPDDGKPSSSLKALTAHYLGRSSLELGMFIPGYDSMKKEAKSAAMQGIFLTMPYESVRLYACADTDNTLALYNHFMNQGIIKKYGAGPTWALENSIVNAVAYSEFHGVHFDSDNFDALEAELDKECQEAYDKCVAIAQGTEFNPNSPQQLQAIMYGQLGYPVREYTASGAPSTAKNVLKWLAEEFDSEGNPLYPFAVHLSEYRDANQVRKSFIKAAVEKGTPDGFLFSSIRQSIETGRMSTSNPNIQGMGDTIKKNFTPRYDFYMVNFDFSSIEYRIIASMAKEESLIEFFQNPIKDYHRFQAALMFDTPYGAVDAKMRKSAKAFNFGIPYGKSDPSLGKDLFGEMTAENTQKAVELKKKYFEPQPHVEGFFNESYEFVERHHYIPTQFGRRRYFNLERLSTTARGVNYKAGMNAMKRQGGNHRIQGTAADLYKMGLRNFFNRIRVRGWWGKVLLTAYVHDECNLEIHKSINPTEVVDELLKSFMLEIPGWCPLQMGMGFGWSWKQAKSQDLPTPVQETLRTQGYNWDGDLDKFITHTEQLRTEWMYNLVVEYLIDPSNIGQLMDADIDSFAHVLQGEAAIKGTHPNLAQFISTHSDDSRLVTLVPLPSEQLAEMFLDPITTTPPSLEKTPPQDIEVPVEVSDLYRETVELVNTFKAVFDIEHQRVVAYVDEECEQLVEDFIFQSPGSYPVFLVYNNDIHSTAYKVSDDFVGKIRAYYQASSQPLSLI